MLLSAQSLFERAVSAGNAGRYAATHRLLDLALARVGDDTNLRARILGTLVYVIAESGDLVRAAAMCKTALEIPGLTSTTRAVVIGQRGSIELRRGEHNQAVRSFSVAIGTLKNEPVLLATTQLNRGVAFLQLGRAREAGADFDQAATSFTEAGLLRRSARARHNQGYAALRSGNLITALNLMDEARANAGAGSLVDAAVCNTDRAEVLLALGRPLEAVDALTAAARVYGARRLRWLQAGAEWSLASTLIHIDPHRARRVARQASIRYRGYGNEVGALRADLLALQAEVAAGGPAPSPQLFALAQVLRERGLRNEATVAEATAVRADLHAKRTDAAAQSLRRIRVSSGAPILTRTLVREVRAEVASARGDKARALAHARRGLEELHEWQSTFGALDLQSSLNMHAQTLTRTGVTAALATGRAARVFEWSERARLNASHLGSPRAPDDERLAAALTELRQLRVEGELTGARTRRDAHLREEVRQQRWKAVGSASTAQIASIHDVQRQLGAHDAVMVLYVWSGHELTALIVAGGYSRLMTLGPLIYTASLPRVCRLTLICTRSG